jgi:hypothetical protein
MDPAISWTPVLSSKETVQRFGLELFRLIFDGENFEEMTAGIGFGGFAMKAAKPIIQRKAVQSLANLSEESAAFLIDKIHKLSADFEDATGIESPYHYAPDLEVNDE